MIQLKILHLDHSAKLTFPAKYERVVLALWSIGLDHDPEKYTLRRLGAEFSFTTEEESHMVRLIDPGNTLMQALCLLSEMMYPPHPVAEKIHKKMAAGGYASEEDFFIEMESFIYDSDLHLQRYYFPVSGEVVDKRGLVRKASDPLLVKYEFYNLDYREAVLTLTSMGVGMIREPVEPFAQKPLQIPAKYENMRRVYGYLLQRRGIDKEVLDAFSYRGLVYECERYHNPNADPLRGWHHSDAVFCDLLLAAAQNTCWPSIPTIAKDLKLSESTIHRALNDLRKAELIQTEQRYRENGGNSSLVYVLT